MFRDICWVASSHNIFIAVRKISVPILCLAANEDVDVDDNDVVDLDNDLYIMKMRGSVC